MDKNQPLDLQDKVTKTHFLSFFSPFPPLFLSLFFFDAFIPKIYASDTEGTFSRDAVEKLIAARGYDPSTFLLLYKMGSRRLMSSSTDLHEAILGNILTLQIHHYTELMLFLETVTLEAEKVLFQ